MSRTILISSCIASIIVALMLPYALQSVLTDINLVSQYPLAAALIFCMVWIACLVTNVKFTNTRINEVSHHNHANDLGREYGAIKWFNVAKGFGFITCDSGQDVFVHFRSIRGQKYRSLQEGQRVSFNVRESDKGNQAEDVTLV
jgi:CspA family cold shock protein